jgi:hypothetical protein
MCEGLPFSLIGLDIHDQTDNPQLNEEEASVLLRTHLDDVPT